MFSFFFNPNSRDYETATLARWLPFIPFALSHIGSFFVYHIHLPMFKKLQSLYEYNIQRHSPAAGEEGVNG